VPAFPATVAKGSSRQTNVAGPGRFVPWSFPIHLAGGAASKTKVVQHAGPQARKRSSARLANGGIKRLHPLCHRFFFSRMGQEGGILVTRGPPVSRSSRKSIFKRGEPIGPVSSCTSREMRAAFPPSPQEIAKWAESARKLGGVTGSKFLLGLPCARVMSLMPPIMRMGWSWASCKGRSFGHARTHSCRLCAGKAVFRKSRCPWPFSMA